MSATLTTKVSEKGELKVPRYLSPDGITLNNRAATIKYMIEQKHDSSHIEIMKNLLMNEDGWTVDEKLPEGWLTRARASSGTLYLTPTWKTCRNKVSVLKFMKDTGYETEIIRNTKNYLYSGKNWKYLSRKNETNCKEQCKFLELDD